MKLAARAFLVLLLVSGFYLLALGLAGLLLYIPYAQYVYAGRIHARSALLCAAGALTILWSIIPRWDRFVPPGPVLKPSEHPRLFAEIRRVAEALRQPLPSEIYLTADYNAGVAHYGGWMGIGARRVMFLGLLMVQELTVSQFRAVIAHEFGHFCGGDVALGPWIFKTRDRIERTLAGLSRRGSALRWPFVWYGRFFLRTTSAIKREQELAADVLAARYAGSRAAIERRIPIRHMAWAIRSYWQEEMAPVLEAGFRPPYAEGFSRYLRAPRVAAALARTPALVPSAGPYDTHPSDQERIMAVRHLPPGDLKDDTASAATLLENVPGLEAELFANYIADGRLLQAVAWEELPGKVFVTGWERCVRERAAILRGLTPESIPGLAGDLARLGRLLSPNLPEAKASELALQTLGMAFGLALARKGGRPHAMPGEPILVEIGGRDIDPHAMVEDAVAGRLSREEWRRECERLGIAGVEMGRG
ncbi:MAG: M48 family metallopeptidase [Patescibacteria group bacterium]